MYLSLILGTFLALCKAQGGQFTPARPPSVPLAVRSPYLNTWLDGPPNGGATWGHLAGTWPTFWTEAVTGWQGLIKVDGANYNWMGAYPGVPLVNQTSLEYTSTRSIFTMTVDGKVEMTAEFLSPVYPNDLSRQSITSSYLEVSVRSLDGAEHDVQVYADVSGEWTSGSMDSIIEWEQGNSDSVVYHKFWRQDQQVFQEQNDQASWGNWYWATSDDEGVTYGTGSHVNLRGRFLNDGSLNGMTDNNFRPINQNWPVFGLSRNLGRVSNDWKRMLFTIGYTQEKAVLFQGAGNQPTEVSSYWTQYYREPDVVVSFFKDWDTAQQASEAIDDMVKNDSIAAAGQDYATLTTLTVRQTFGGLTYTGTSDKVYVWQKEISSASWAQTVDVIFPMWPFMLYFDPKLIRYTLNPLLENQESGHYPNLYAMHDLGRYPRALGYPAGHDEPMPLEESGNMIIMMLSYAQRTGDAEYLRQHHTIMEQWADFLIANAKIPEDQLSTDDFAGPAANQTNLAIKGIIGLYAMSEVERITGDMEMQRMYSDIASNYLAFWMQNGIESPGSQLPSGNQTRYINQSITSFAAGSHAMLQYNEPDSYGLLYNIYADKALRLNKVPESIFNMQSAFYPTVMEEYGVVLDTRANWTKLDWEIFAAAVASRETRDTFLRTIVRWINQTSANRALTDLYDVVTGGYPQGLFFTARPVVGGAFAILGL